MVVFTVINLLLLDFNEIGPKRKFPILPHGSLTSLAIIGYCLEISAVKHVSGIINSLEPVSNSILDIIEVSRLNPYISIVKLDFRFTIVHV